MNRDPDLPSGVRSVTIVKADGSGLSADDVQSVDVIFGPHHRVHIEVQDGRTMIAVVATHHGVRLDASDVAGELEQAINHLRDLWPEKAVD
jgi:hypothetical protein